MEKSPAIPTLSAEVLAIVRGGVSVSVGSRDRAMQLSLMRAIGSDVNADGSRITVFLTRSQSGQLLQHIASTGRLAVVFSEPSTLRRVEIKGGRAILRPAGEDDRPKLARALALVEQQVARDRLTPALARALLAHWLDDVVAVSFTPEQILDQPLSPRASRPNAGDSAQG